VRRRFGFIKVRGWAFDLTLAAVLLVIGIVTHFAYQPESHIDYRTPDLLGVAFVVAYTVPLALRRAAPLGVALTFSAVNLPYLVWDYPALTAGVVALIAAYSLGAYSPLARSLLGMAALFCSTYLYLIVTANRFPDEGLGATEFVFVAMGFIGAWAIGRAVRAPRQHIQLLAERAEHLERTREAEVRAALAEERGQIARELHDVVAHHVSVMTVQAAGARRTLERDPDRSREAMEAIEATGRSALTEMRRIVGVLRGPDGKVAAAPGRTPQPGLADLPDLVEQFGTTGLPVELTVTGDAPDLPLGVDLTAYRVIQEALTNTLKHSGGASARVGVRYSPTELAVEVTDTGRGPTPSLNGRRPGHGLLGMRERVAVYGGSLHIGSQPSGGFAVRARIPVDSAT
jgi:signal transduction histidine kinase